MENKNKSSSFCGFAQDGLSGAEKLLLTQKSSGQKIEKGMGGADKLRAPQETKNDSQQGKQEQK